MTHVSPWSKWITRPTPSQLRLDVGSPMSSFSFLFFKPFFFFFLIKNEKKKNNWATDNPLSVFCAVDHFRILNRRKRGSFQLRKIANDHRKNFDGVEQANKKQRSKGTTLASLCKF